jgi:hypothetical protein
MYGMRKNWETHRECIRGDFHDIAVELLAQRAQLRNVQEVFWGKPPARLGDGQDPVTNERRLVWTQEVLRARHELRDVKLRRLTRRVEPGGGTDVARSGGGRRVGQDDFGQAIRETVADVRIEIRAADQADDCQKRPDVDPDGLGLDLFPDAYVELACERGVWRVHVVCHSWSHVLQAQYREVFAAEEGLVAHEPPEVGRETLHEVHQGEAVRGYIRSHVALTEELLAELGRDPECHLVCDVVALVLVFSQRYTEQAGLGVDWHEILGGVAGDVARNVRHPADWAVLWGAEAVVAEAEPDKFLDLLKIVPKTRVHPVQIRGSLHVEEGVQILDGYDGAAQVGGYYVAHDEAAHVDAPGQEITEDQGDAGHADGVRVDVEPDVLDGLVLGFAQRQRVDRFQPDGHDDSPGLVPLAHAAESYPG